MTKSEPWIRRIEVLDNRVHEPFEIDLSPPEGERLRHLILTGRNGSGKSSTLEAIWGALSANARASMSPEQRQRWQESGENLAAQAADLEAKQAAASDLGGRLGAAVGAGVAAWLSRAIGAAAEPGETSVSARLYTDAGLLSAEGFSGPPSAKLQSGLFEVNITAVRDLKVDRVESPQAEQPESYLSEAPQAARIGQFLVNRRTRQAFAREDGDDAEAQRLAVWFSDVERQFAEVLEEPSLKLHFDRSKLTFSFEFNGSRAVNFNVLPHGFRSILQIWAEIAIRIDSLGQRVDDGVVPRGVVLIDELESHLHLSLQEHILPFLTTLFPEVQFIVSTHSPAIITSIADAVVYDLSTQEQVQSRELQGIRYGDLMMGHFGISSDFDLRSTKELTRLKELADKGERSEEEQQELEGLAQRLSGRSHNLALQVWTELEYERGRSE